jgi:hypothetical protein
MCFLTTYKCFGFLFQANYSARTQLDENSKDLDVQALYVMERGMAHGRVPIGDGCVDKQALAATAKSRRSSASTVAYQNMVDEYDELKERYDALHQTNKKLNENNEILFEENGVNRELMLVINITFHATTY